MPSKQKILMPRKIAHSCRGLCISSEIMAYLPIGCLQGKERCSEKRRSRYSVSGSSGKMFGIIDTASCFFLSRILAYIWVV